MEIETFGRRFKIPDDEHIKHTFLDHEPVLQRWCEGIKPGDVVVDVGACYGSYTLPALAAGAYAIAYEPVPQSAKILSDIVEMNGWSDMCAVRELALWDGTEYPELLREQVFGMHYPSKVLNLTRLDDDMGPLGIHHSQIKRMKLDVEGAEYGVMMGAHNVLIRSRPYLIIEDHESVSKDPNDEVSRYPERIKSRWCITKLLDALGYKIENVPWDVSRNYIVATPPEHV